MRPVRAAAAAAVLTVTLVTGVGAASAQTTTTTAPPAGMPGTALPVTGAPAPAAGETEELARTGSELVPVVNTAMGLIAAGFALVIGTERRRTARRRTASVWSC